MKCPPFVPSSVSAFVRGFSPELLVKILFFLQEVRIPTNLKSDGREFI